MKEPANEKNEVSKDDVAQNSSRSPCRNYALHHTLPVGHCCKCILRALALCSQKRPQLARNSNCMRWPTPQQQQRPRRAWLHWRRRWNQFQTSKRALDKQHHIPQCIHMTCTLTSTIPFPRTCTFTLMMSNINRIVHVHAQEHIQLVRILTKCIQLVSSITLQTLLHVSHP